MNDGLSSAASPVGDELLRRKSIGFPHRVTSIDIFRGFTMLLMIFVNDLAGVRGLPWWNYHLPASANGMTYVDMVFPAFLFIVGMSIPLSVQSRLTKGDSTAQLWIHVITRSFSLLVLGIALANADKGDPRLMGISRNAWGALLLTGAIAFWNVYPRVPSRQWLFRSLKFAGLILMLGLFTIFRRTTSGGEVRWLDFSYWEILGLIGWTYLAVCLLYIPTRRWRWAPLVWLVLLCVLNACSAARWISFPEALPFFFWPWNNGAFSVMVLAGVVTTRIGLGDGSLSLRSKAVRVLGFGVVLLAAGWLLSPLGISKIRATPAWALYSSGAGALIFWGLHWVCDVRNKKRWAEWTKAAGTNTLLTYLLPDLFYFGIGTRWVPRVFDSGAPGLVRALVFTGLILGAATLLTRARVRLQL